jgi:hypothetical protein
MDTSACCLEFLKILAKKSLFPWVKNLDLVSQKENVRIFSHFFANFTTVLLMARDNRVPVLSNSSVSVPGQHRQG